MPFLTTETLDFRDGQTLHADIRQCLTDIVQFKGFNDCDNLFHDFSFFSC